MKKILKIVAILTVLFGVWLIYWGPVQHAFEVLGPENSIIVGVIIIIVGGIIGIKAF